MDNESLVNELSGSIDTSPTSPNIGVDTGLRASPEAPNILVPSLPSEENKVSG